jgi:two-component system, OmpR family, KDP operon response regulator KdpE
MDDQTSGPAPFRTVLVADPSSDNADTLALVLAAVGHRPVTAGTVADAVARAAAHPPDAVIADALFPDGHAAVLAAQLAGRPLLILVTGWPVSAEQATRAGFHYVFTKPADPEAILALLDAHTRCRPGA